MDHGVLLLTYLPLLTVGAFVQCWGVTLHGALIAQGKPSGLFMANFSALLIFAFVYVLLAYSHGVWEFVTRLLHSTCGYLECRFI